MWTSGGGDGDGQSASRCSVMVIQNAPDPAAHVAARLGSQSKASAAVAVAAGNDWSAGVMRMRVCYTSIIRTTIDSIERGEATTRQRAGHDQHTSSVVRRHSAQHRGPPGSATGWSLTRRRLPLRSAQSARTFV